MHRLFDCFKKTKVVVIVEEDDVLGSSDVIDNIKKSEKIENMVDNFTEGVLDAGTEAALAVMKETGDKFDDARDSMRETVSTQFRPAVNLVINEDVLVDDIPLTNEPRDRVRPGTPIPASLLEALREVEGKE